MEKEINPRGIQRQKNTRKKKNRKQTEAQKVVTKRKKKIKL